MTADIHGDVIVATEHIKAPPEVVFPYFTDRPYFPEEYPWIEGTEWRHAPCGGVVFSDPVWKIGTSAAHDGRADVSVAD